MWPATRDAAQKALRLGLPLACPWQAWGWAALAGVLYAYGSTPDTGFYDSPELILAAQSWGLGHPPGQPLHTLLGALLARLPLGPIPYRVALLSCLSGAVCVLSALSLLDACLKRLDVPVTQGARALGYATLALWSQHALLWEQATRAEVYALSAAGCLWVIAQLAQRLDAPLSPRAASAVGVALGLSACANPVLAMGTALALLPAWIVAWRRGLLGPRQSAWALAGGLLGLAPYAYVPLVASLSDAFVWGRPDTPSELLGFLRAADYASNLRLSGWQWAWQLGDWLRHAAHELWLPLWGLGLLGWLWLPARSLGRAFLPLLAALSTLYLTHNAVWHPDVPDYASYASVPGFVCASAWAAGVAALASRRLYVAAGALTAAALATVLLAPPGPLVRTRRHDHTAATLVAGLLAHTPPQSILVAESDHWLGPLLFAQHRRDQRPDVVVLAMGLSGSSWYWRELYRQHPGLVPFPIRGPGGRVGRVRRFLAAQGARDVWLEHRELAERLNLRACPDWLFVRADVSCSPKPALQHAVARSLHHMAARIGAGSPTSEQVLAAIALRHGDALWAEGQATDALATYLSVHPQVQPAKAGSPDFSPRQAPSPSWRRSAAIGDPARTLYRAAQLAAAWGMREQASEWLALAAARGLPEAK